MRLPKEVALLQELLAPHLHFLEVEDQSEDFLGVLGECGLLLDSVPLLENNDKVDPWAV